MKRHVWDLKKLAVAAGLLALLGTTPAGADVITYNNGKVIKGLIQETPEDAENITFMNETGKIRIPRSRIRTIAKESKAQGYVHIGTAYMGRQEYNQAIKTFQLALDAEPGNAAAQAAMNEAQAKISEQNRLSRSEALGQIDKMCEQVRALVKQGEFEKAEEKLKEADRLVPNAEQTVKLKALISEMYLAWADERQDKLDPAGAEEKLNVALAANPNNEKVIERMLKLWENNPQKREQTTNIYETILERHPEDRSLRKKLGDLYYEMGRTEDSVHHYLALYRENDEYKGTQLEERLIEELGKLHMEFARKKDYDKAIYYFQILAALDKEVNPTDVVYYQYFKRQQEVKPTDVKGRLELAKFAEENGLDSEALPAYRSLLASSDEAVKTQAQAGVDRYAMKAFQMAQMQFQGGNYALAAALSDQVRTDFPNSQRVQEQASELSGRAQAEAAKDRRQRRDLGRDVVQRADDYYQQGWFHYNNIFSTERRNNPLLINDRDMSKKYFGLAVDAYQEALRIDPSLGSDSQSLVNVRLNECRNLLQRLSQGPSNMPRNFGRSMLQP